MPGLPCRRPAGHHARRTVGSTRCLVALPEKEEEIDDATAPSLCDHELHGDCMSIRRQSVRS